MYQNRKILAVLIILTIFCINIPQYVFASNNDASYDCDRPVRIMPLGDTITKGGITNDGYRSWLYWNLTESGHYVDFVGSLRDGKFVTPPFDTDHMGIFGLTVYELKGLVYGMLKENPADIVLLLIGAADIVLQRNSVDYTVSNVEEILDNIDQYENDYDVRIKVILASYGTLDDYPQFSVGGNKKWSIEYGDAIDNMALKRIDAGDDIVLVDMRKANFTSADLEAGGLYLNKNGYKKVAAVWYEELHEILPVCENVPKEPIIGEQDEARLTETPTPIIITEETPKVTEEIPLVQERPSMGITEITIVGAIIIAVIAGFILISKRKSKK